jgi:hypothetical protein
MAAITSGAATEAGVAGRATQPAPVIWQALVLAIGVFVLAHNGFTFALRGVGVGYMNLGIDLSRCGPDAFCEITGGRVSPFAQGVNAGAAVAPGGPLAKAGVRDGDALRLDQPMDFARQWRPDEAVGATVRRGGVASHVVIRAGVRPPATTDVRAFRVQVLACSLICLIGMFVTLRGGRRLSTLLFGATLVSLGLVNGWPTLPESTPWLFPASISLLRAVFRFAPLLLLAFAVAVRREARDEPARAWAPMLLAYAAAAAIVWAYSVWASLTGRQLFDFGATLEAQMAVSYLGYGLAFFGLSQVWRESRGQERTRSAFMLLASSLVAAPQLFGFAINLTGNNFALNNPLFLFMVGGPLGGAAVFAYAVMRHRVLDLGFAVNRTLVYAAVSAILLAAFGLIEWAIDHFVPVAGREKNAIVDAAIAVGVFLTFHRVRDVVEHGVEALFFRRWQQAEAALRRFVREAAFITEAATLEHAFAGALSRYAEGAEAAVYLADGRRFQRVAGDVTGVPADLGADTPLLVSARAELKPVEAADGERGPALVAPMVNRNEVIGAVALGPKPSGLDYRPDELELIGWATRQVGLDLHALKVEQLEEAAAALRYEVAALRSVIPQRAWAESTATA